MSKGELLFGTELSRHVANLRRLEPFATSCVFGFFILEMASFVILLVRRDARVGFLFVLLKGKMFSSFCDFIRVGMYTLREIKIVRSIVIPP